MINDKKMIRVVIADDSAFIRYYLTELFRTEPSIEVVGVASNAEEAIHLSSELHPDVLTMDYHMPDKNGIEAAAAIMLGPHPLPSIVMISAFLGEDGKELRRTLEASGALVATKPSGEGSLDIEKIAREILEKVKIAGNAHIAMRKREAVVEPRPELFYSHDEHHPSLVVVIGASTGGPPLIEHLLTTLNPHLGVAVVVVQHMSKYFTQIFAERLDRVTEFHVHEAHAGDTLSPGSALVVPGGAALRAETYGHTDAVSLPKIILDEEHDFRHEEAIDKTMQSIAECYGEHVCGVLLSGMGSDGVLGLGAIKKYGGYTIAQDPQSAAIAFMPRHAIKQHVVDEICSVEGIPRAIVEHYFKAK